METIPPPAITDVQFTDALDSGRYSEASLRFPELFTPLSQGSISSMLYYGVRTHGERLVIPMAQERIFGLLDMAFLEYQKNIPSIYPFSNPQRTREFVCLVPLPHRLYVTRYILPSDEGLGDINDLSWFQLLLKVLNHPWEEFSKSDTRKYA